MTERVDGAGIHFDHTSPDIAGPRFWGEVRRLQEAGPLVWVNDHGGFWAVTAQELVVRMAQDWENFSSGTGTMFPNRPKPNVMPYIMPVDIDPPRQRVYRKAVNPSLVPGQLLPLEAGIRDIADELIDTFIERGRCDIAVQFARRFPGTVFFRLIVKLGDEEFERVERAAWDMSFSVDPSTRGRASVNLRGWAKEALEKNAGDPTSKDVISAIKRLAETGEPFAEHEYYSGLSILAQGGIGTSANAIGAIMRLLAEHPQVQERVRADLSLVPAVVEESLRLEPPLPLMFRRVKHDIEVEGQELKAGQWLALFFGAANRDPDVYGHPDEFDIDRPHFRHLTFGAGPHRCIGSNLARQQIRIAIEQLVSRLSPFEIPAGAVIEYASNQARGISSMPLGFTPGAASAKWGRE
jgi:cytochrome P450